MIASLLLVALGAPGLPSPADDAAGGRRDARPIVAAATIVYGEKSSARCFSESFLRLARESSSIPAPEKLAPVALTDPSLAEHPFALLSGEGFFTFAPEERDALRRFVMNGGFLLASAGCSSAAWDRSLRDELDEIFPESRLSRIPEDHAVFSMLVPVASIRLKDGTPAHLEGIDIDGRFGVVYSAAGLNDTASLPDCCCCTGTEVADSPAILANLFAYALLAPR